MDSLKAIIFCLLAISMGGGTCTGYVIRNLLEPNCSKTSQCDVDHYEVNLSLTQLSGFPDHRISCYKNRNDQIRHYVCFKCSVCEQLVVLLECGRKHDTICSNNCTNPDAVYDLIQKKCIPKVEPSTTVYKKLSVYIQTTEAGLDLQYTTNLRRLRGITVNETILAIANDEHHGIKPTLLIITLGVVNVNVVVICSLIIMKRRRSKRNREEGNLSSISHQNTFNSKNIPSTIATVRNEATVNVVCGENQNPTSDNRNIGVIVSCDMSVGGATPVQKTVIGSKSSTHDPFWLEMKAMVGPEGGIVSDSRSSVSLIIPPGAIPENRAMQEIIVRVALKPSMFGLHQENDRHLLSPVVECLSPGLNGFNSCVTLVVPHRANLDPDWKFQVLHSEDKYSDPVSNFRWTVTEYKPTETHGVQFEVDKQFFRIKTTHFTTYACAGCHRKAPLNLEVVVYGGYSDIGGRQRVDLRCYVCDTIKDYSTQIRKHEPNNPLCIPRPIIVDKKAKQIKIILPEDEFGPDWQWTSETFNGSLPNIRVIDVMHATRCCSEAMSHYENFTLKPKQEDKRLDFLEATLRVMTSGQSANGYTAIIGPIRIDLTTDIGQKHSPIHGRTDIVSCEQLEAVSKDIPITEWKGVYRTLHTLSNFGGMADIDIQNVEGSNPGQVQEMKYQILMLWLKRAGRKATPGTLIQALSSCGLNQIVYSHFHESSI